MTVITRTTPGSVATLPEPPPGESRRRPPLVTSRSLWLAGFAVTGLALVARLPALKSYTGAEMDRTEVGVDLASDTMRNLAVNTGLLLAIILSLVVLALYFSLASVMERNLFRARRSPTSRIHVGLFGSVAFLTVFPPHVWCAVSGQVSVRASAWFIGYVAAVGLVTPLAFMHSLRKAPAGRRAIIWLLSLVLALLAFVL